MEIKDMDIGTCKVTLQTLLKKDVRFRKSTENRIIVELYMRMEKLNG